MARFKGVAGEYPRGGRTGDKEQWRQRVNPYNVTESGGWEAEGGEKEEKERKKKLFPAIFFFSISFLLETPSIFSLFQWRICGATGVPFGKD